MKGDIQILEFRDAVRKRPGMYLGAINSEGIVNLFKGLIVDCIDIIKAKQYFFHISINSEFDFELHIKSSDNLSAFTDTLGKSIKEFKQIHLKILDAVNNELEIKNNSPNELLLKFSLDSNIFKETVDYLELNELILQLAFLNRNSEFLLKDNRTEYQNQNYYFFPQGIKYLYDRTARAALGKPDFEMFFDDSINGLKYQIFIGYRTDWYPPASIATFANDVHTTCGGSLANGVLGGLIDGCRQYVKANKLNDFKIKKKKLTNGLILIASVRGNDFKYGGSFKETLEDKEVEKDIKKAIKKLTLDFINKNKEKADKFLWRFDETQLTSGMY